MKKKTYVIDGLCKGLDGLVVDAVDSEAGDDDGNFKAVIRIVNKNYLVGDRELAVAVPNGALMIDPSYLKEVCEQGPREFTAERPFGKHVYDKRYSQGGIEVACSMFETHLCVTVLDKTGASTRTLVSRNFDLEEYHCEYVIELIETYLESSDAESLPLAIREITPLDGKEND